MLTLRGAPALSEFRRQKLAGRLAEALGFEVELYAEFVHFVETSQGLDESETGVLEQLLRYGPELPAHEPSGTLVLAVPRPGTISPWSSKATDIAHNCGLERGAAHRARRRLLPARASSLDDAELDAAMALLHDRMTEAVLLQLRRCRAPCSAHAAPQPLRTVDVLGGGREALVAANARAGPGAVATTRSTIWSRASSASGATRRDVELMMFAQANSEHCRHKIFNADWIIDGEPQDALAVRDDPQHAPSARRRHVLSAYKDNAAVIEGSDGGRFFPDPEHRRLRASTTRTSTS